MPTNRTIAILAFAALAGASTLAVAEMRTRVHGPGSHHSPAGPLLLGADSDGDGNVTAAEWSALFTALDADKDGKLAASEMPMPRFGPPPAEMLVFMIADGADTDSDGTVTHSEWQARIAAIDGDKDGALAMQEIPIHRHHHGAEIHPGMAERMEGFATGMVARWDEDGDGKLTSSELDAAFTAADDDGDGVLTFKRREHSHR